ncbi:MAG: metal-dependent hydrolase [Desulfatitalea sp. BRH_c12]|nr:MAG: metal-dependent hydrolase [Desulfatitalea sp. BRH_c12]
MTTKRKYIEVRDIQVEVVRKAIKNLHLAVYPPEGRVRVAVPLHVTDENIRLAVISKLGWIRRQQTNFNNQSRQSQREMVSGESHYFMGRRYLLDVIHRQGKHEVVLSNNSKMTLYVQLGTSIANKEKVLQEWYRDQLKTMMPDLIKEWEAVIGVQINQWAIKRMKTRWGACNIAAKRIWLNLELAKKPPECLTYILVHELVHLLERHHNDRFKSLMDRFLPSWRMYREELNRAPLAHEEWVY